MFAFRNIFAQSICILNRDVGRWNFHFNFPLMNLLIKIYIYERGKEKKPKLAQIGKLATTKSRCGKAKYLSKKEKKRKQNRGQKYC